MNKNHSKISLKLNQIFVSRGNFEVIKNLSFLIESGDIIIIKGRDGSGKTTLLKTIAGFLPIKSGNIFLSNHIGSNKFNKRFLWIGEKNCLSPELTGLQNLSSLLSLFNIDVIDKFKECLDEFNTINFINRKIKFLSSGEKQRIVLTRLVFFLKLNHQIWILDEPINNLDSQNNNSFCNILKKHKSNGGITIMSTHVPLVQNFRVKEILLD